MQNNQTVRCPDCKSTNLIFLENGFYCNACDYLEEYITERRNGN